MNKFNLYDLISKLAVAASQKTADKNADAEESAPAEAAPKSAPSADAAPKKSPPDLSAVMEMLRRHDKKSREIDERVKELEKSEQTPTS